jgi:hypothetical protein
MSKKLFLMISFILLTGLAGSASAMDLFWLNTSGDGLWKTQANWTGGILPTIVDKTKINQVPGPLIDAGTAAVANHVVVGDGGTGGLRITGGTFNVGTAPGDTWMIVAYGAADVGTITMDDGTVTTADRVFVGFQGNGTLNMNGGTMNIGGTFGIGYGEGFTTGRGYVYLNGGTINASLTTGSGLVMSSPTGCLGYLDIDAGTLNVKGDRRAAIQTYIDNGYITSYGGLGIVTMTYDGVTTTTTLTGAVDVTKAKLPYPANSAIDVAPYVVLSWMSGDYTVTHDIYFGTDANSVRDANTLTVGIYQGWQPRGTESFEPTGLELGKKYYWRIDEVNDPCVYKGNLWQFTVANYALVDDFEKYADTNDLLLSWSNTGTGGALSLATTGGHDKAKTMKFDYNNSGEPNYSEAQTADVDYDWTIAGVLAIDVWYKGDANNAAEQMYAALEDNNSNPVAVVVNSDPNVKSSDWQVWRIKLADFTGVNLANIKKFYLGFGDRNNPAAGGTGTVYFDDIRLHPTRCINKPAEDLNDDCVVDFEDFAIMAKNWMGSSSI